jgi:L-ascorbate metabolism protein UlaG (beta-lactamase superfamily)
MVEMGKKVMVGIVAVIIVLLGVSLLYIQQPQFGRAPSGQRLARIQASLHYVEGKFQCLEPVEKIVEKGQGTAMLKFLFGSTQGLIPNDSIPSHKTDLKALDPQEAVLVWMGHSSFYMQLNGYRILVDPVFSSYASPLSFINKAFAGSNIYSADDMPDIDVLIMSHDHWDHLDYDTIKSLQPKIKAIICPLGVGEYFEEWGFAPEQIHEEDWFTEVKLAEDLSVFVLPSQHFSGRMLKQNQTEWAGFAFITPQRKVFYSGDGGYGRHFKAIGEQFGGFDLAILEDGQYNADWPRIHMMPEETAQAAVDVRAKTVLPVHNGKFALARHAWQEPYERLAAASADKDYALLTPEIGEKLDIGSREKSNNPWWREIQ